MEKVENVTFTMCMQFEAIRIVTYNLFFILISPFQCYKFLSICETIVRISKSGNFYRRHLRAHRSSCWTYMLTSLGFSKGLRRNPTDGALARSDQPNDATTSP